MNIQLEVVSRGVLPNDNALINQLARDAETDRATVIIQAQRLKAITEYVIALRNKYNGKKAIVNYFRAAREVVESNGHVDHCPLPTKQEWRDADNSSMAAMAEYQKEFRAKNVQSESEKSSLGASMHIYQQLPDIDMRYWLDCVAEFNKRHPLYVAK